MGGAVAVTDKDVVAVEMIGGTVAGSLILFLVAFEEDGAATLQHVGAFAVEVGTVDTAAAPYGNAVVALAALTAVVPRHKEVVVVAMLHDEGCLDGIAPCVFRSGIGGHGLALRVVAAGYGAGLLAAGQVHGGIQPGYLDAVPEGTPQEPRLVVIVDNETGVNGIPLVALGT